MGNFKIGGPFVRGTPSHGYAHDSQKSEEFQERCAGRRAAASALSKAAPPSIMRLSPAIMTSFPRANRDMGNLTVRREQNTLPFPRMEDFAGAGESRGIQGLRWRKVQLIE